MNKEILLKNVSNLDKNQNQQKDKIVAWVSSLQGSQSVINSKPTQYKKGDVLMHTIFRHPYVLLEKKDDYWICVLLTSNANCEEVLEACNSRFFPDSYFTMNLFTVKEPTGTFGNVFENVRQLNRVLKTLREIFGS